MPAAKVRFDRPPIMETVLGVQFAPLPGLTAAHLGWFWKGFLGPEWDGAANAPPVPDQFERFGAEQDWEALNRIKLMLGGGMPTGRIQLTSRQDERMIQAQHTRFHYNWQRREQEYPHYEEVRPEFDAYFDRFREFADIAGIGPVHPNQWELTYINHIPQGELWQTPDDWHRVLPGLFGIARPLGASSLESFGGEWHYEIKPERGRLHVAAQVGRLEGGTMVLRLDLTARGPANDWATLATGLDLGHEAILEAFTGLTSPEAQQAWGIQK